MKPIIYEVPPGDNPCPDDIVDPLITSVAQAMAKGRSAYSKSHRRRAVISGTCSMQPYMAPGSIILYTDRQGNQRRALLRRSPLVMDRSGGKFSATTSVVMEYKK